MAVDPKVLQKIFDRIEANNHLSQQDLQTLSNAARSQQITIATGDRAVAIGASADGAVVVTGDNNVIGDRLLTITGANAEAIRELLGKRPRTESLLLQAVKAEVKTRLEQSLLNAVPIQLGIKVQLEQVQLERDWNPLIGNESRELVSKDKTILHVFDDVQGKLLILGSPGAGKTKTLLDLAEELCDRAECDTEYPIPILFNLTTWNNRQGTIKDWLLRELNSKYGVRKDICKQWLESRQLLPMLDGLDEVEPKHQATCVHLINQFLHSETRPLHLVVCCRQEIYERVVQRQWQKEILSEIESNSVEQKTRLHLNGSILLEPLNNKQIQEYLLAVKQEVLWRFLEQDIDLLSLARIPLFLAILGFISSSKKLSFEEMTQSVKSEMWRKFLFDTYWEIAITRSIATQEMQLQGQNSRTYGTKKLPLRRQTRFWLVYLARQLEREQKTVFLIEEIQPTWLFKNKHRWMYSLIIWLISSLVNIIISGLFFGVAIGVFSGILHSQFETHIDKIYVDMLVGILLGLSGGTVAGLPLNLLLLLLRKLPNQIQLSEKLGWSWKSSGSGFISFIVFAISLIAGILSGGLIVLLVTLLIFGSAKSQPLVITIQSINLDVLIYPLIIMLLTGGFMFGMAGGIETKEIEFKTKSNQGIFRSLISALQCSLILGLSFGLFSGVLSVLIVRQVSTELFENIVVGVVFGVCGGLLGIISGAWFAGGLASVQHFLLRLILCKTGSTPWNYAQFLDYCTERLLLQKIGGRYRFIHRLLQEHFASMTLDK